MFDVAHLLDGKGLFYDVADDPEWVHELLGICLDLYLRVTRHLKSLLDEPEGAMVHGHGTPQGVYFSHAGARTSEDTATLLSPRMIEEFVLPYTERAVRPFEALRPLLRPPPLTLRAALRVPPRARHRPREQRGVRPPLAARALRRVGHGPFRHVCGAEPGEDWRAYVERIAGLVRQTGARCILRPMAHPDSREECAAMRDLWHELT